MMAVNDPRANPTLIPSSATTAASPSPWTLRTSRRATAGAVAAAAATPLAGTFMSFPFLLGTCGDLDQR